MNFAEFDRHVRTVRARAAALQERAEHAPPGRAPEVLAAALRELADAAEELRAAEEQLREQRDELLRTRAEAEAQRARYQELFERAPEAYLITDRHATVLEANRAALTLFNVTAKGIGRKSLATFLAAPARREFRAALARVCAAEGPVELEVRIKPRRRPPVDAAVTVAAIRDARGAVTSLRWQMRDVTERRRAEEEARTLTIELEARVLDRTAELERANRLKDELLVRERRARGAAQRLQRRQAFLAEASALLGSTLDYQQTLPSVARLAVPALADWCLVDVIEDDRSIVRAAVAYADFSRLELAATLRRRYPPEEAHRHPALAAMRSGRAERLYGVPFALLETTIREREFLSFLRASGMQSGVFLPLVVRGKALGVVTLLSSRSARRYGPEELSFVEDFASRIAHAVDAAQLYRQAQEANQAKADFLAVMSHELRTPLNAIVGYTELLAMGLPEAVPPGARTHVERIGAASVHLLQVIEEILVFSRLEAGRAEGRDVVRGGGALVEPLAASKGLTLRVAEPPAAVELRTDARKVRHVLVNLLANAIKFTERGMVTVSIHERADEVVLGVADTGIGIPREHLDRIFDPFWQGERLAKRRGGTGLGLSIVRRLTELLGGAVAVDSTLGVGTTFEIVLPRWGAGAGGETRETERQVASSV